MATTVKQLTGATCVLACFESIMADTPFQVERLDQRGIFEKLPYESGDPRYQQGAAEGTVRLLHIPSLALGLGLCSELRFGRASAVLLETQPQFEGSGGFALVVRRASGFDAGHCVRVLSMTPGQQLEVMDPTDGQVQTWQWSDLARAEYFALVGWGAT